MKILCVIDSLGSGGAQKQLITLAEGLKERGYEITFLVYHHKTFYYNKIIELGIGYILVDESNFIKRFLMMRRVIRRGSYHTIISFLDSSNFICNLSSFPYKEWKLIIGERSANPNILKSPKLRAYRWFHFFADYIISNSQSNINIVKKANPFLSNKKIKIIYNGLDVDYWSLNEKKNIRVDNKITITIFSSHQYLKNGIKLVNAISLLDTNLLENIQFHWYGDQRQDNSYNEILKEVEKCNLQSKVRFYPATTNVKEKIFETDFVGLFSLYEGFPNIICEAMLLGKPVIVSNVSDIPKILSGTENIICDPNSTSSIAEAIIKAIKLDRNAMIKIGERNREIALKMFDKEKMIEKYEQLI